MQSNYIPWKGYFDLIRHSDVFIFLDDVQYTKENWRNRARVKSPNGLQWLTIPVHYDAKVAPAIAEVTVADPKWSAKHVRRMASYYYAAPFHKEIMALLTPLYEEAATFTHLSAINRFFLERISRYLGIDTEFRTSTELYDKETLASYPHNAERLVSLCQAVGADMCANGPRAKEYTDDVYCLQHGVTMRYADYSHYAEYPQLHGTFEHGASIVDLLMMTGPEAKHYLSDRLLGDERTGDNASNRV